MIKVLFSFKFLSSLRLDQSRLSLHPCSLQLSFLDTTRSVEETWKGRSPTRLLTRDFAPRGVPSVAVSKSLLTYDGCFGAKHRWLGAPLESVTEFSDRQSQSETQSNLTDRGRVVKTRDVSWWIRFGEPSLRQP